MLSNTPDSKEYNNNNNNIEKKGDKLKNPFKKYERKDGSIRSGKLIKDQKKRLEKYINSERYTQILQGEYNFSDKAENFKNKLSFNNDQYKNTFGSNIEVNITEETGTIEIEGTTYIVFVEGLNLISTIYDRLLGLGLLGGVEKFDKKLIKEIGQDITYIEDELKKSGIKGKLFIRKIFNEEFATIKNFDNTNNNNEKLMKISNYYNLTNTAIALTKEQSNLNINITKKAYNIPIQTNISKNVKDDIEQRKKNIISNKTHIIDIKDNNEKLKIEGTYYPINKQNKEDYYDKIKDDKYSSAIKDHFNNTKNGKLFPGDIIIPKTITNFLAPIHEFAHKSVDGNFHLLQKTRKLLNSFLELNEKNIIKMLEETENIPADKFMEYKKTIDYIFSLSEIYANIISLKYVLDLFDIADPMTEEITTDHLLLLIKEVDKLPKNSKTKKDINSLLNFFMMVLLGKDRNYLEDNNKENKKIRENLELLMNNIADNNSSGDQNIV